MSDKKYTCICGREFDNPQAFNGHKSNCREHLISKGTFDSYEKRLHDSELRKRRSETLKRRFYDKWRSEKHVCEKCGKLMERKYGSGRFCCRSCANSRHKTDATKEKVSRSLRNSISHRESCTERHDIWLASETKKYNESPTRCVVCHKILPFEKRKKQVCSKECQYKLISEKHRKRCSEMSTNLCGKGKRGYYKGYYCQSSWELAYVIYCLEHGINVERCERGFKYTFEGKERTYYPDFYLPVTDTYIEVKGYYDAKSKAKKEQFVGNLLILQKREMKPILNYVIEKYGKNFVDMYEVKYYN